MEFKLKKVKQLVWTDLKDTMRGGCNEKTCSLRQRKSDQDVLIDCLQIHI